MRYLPHSAIHLWIDSDNLEATVLWLRTHNKLAQSKSPAEAESWLLEQVLKNSPGADFRKAADRLQSGLGVHWFIQEATWIGQEPGSPSHYINFFIRPGRPAALSAVG